MRKILAALLGLVFVSTAAMAQAPAVPATASTPAAAAPATTMEKAPVAQSEAAASTQPAEATAMTVSGKVDAVTLADPSKNVQAQIALTDKDEKKSAIIVKDTTTIYNDKSETISLDKITAGQNVRVKYTTAADGSMEAVSIHVVM